ncbi:MAG: hypothetical protein KF893_09970 [Caldilineaceae bacterium]|nr:hypothetical protein [Caldilineaceae bacterium]
MADTRILLEGLIEYRASLSRHLSTLQSEFEAVQSRWQVFSAVYDGDAADEFKSYWTQTVGRFNEYITRTTRIAHMLDERIDHLREVNRREGIL